MDPTLKWFAVAAISAFILQVTAELAEVSNLTGYADYRYVALNWDYDNTDPSLYGFQVHYCELQVWGPHRCKVKTISKENLPGSSFSSRQQRNSYIVPGLRMSTNYTFEIRPVATKRMDREFHNPKISKSVVVSTKGFSAKATLCLPTESEIEVSTGPYFGGRVGVEAADGTRCTVDGDGSSPRDVYTLRINHQACGSVVNETTVSTFVLVQENLPILTHSTRRFLVLCTVQPDTLTVRARLNLPHRNTNSVDEEEAHGSVASAELSLEDEGDNEIGANVRRRDGRMLHLKQGEANYEAPTPASLVKGDTIVQLILMMGLVVAGAVGCATIIWYSARKTTQTANNQDDTSSTLSYDASISSEPSEINFEIESVCGLSDSGSRRNAHVHHI